MGHKSETFEREIPNLTQDLYDFSPDVAKRLSQRARLMFLIACNLCIRPARTSATRSKASPLAPKCDSL